jgi:hypothetical protein
MALLQGRSGICLIGLGAKQTEGFGRLNRQRTNTPCNLFAVTVKMFIARVVTWI